MRWAGLSADFAALGLDARHRCWCDSGDIVCLRNRGSHRNAKSLASSCSIDVRVAGARVGAGAAPQIELVTPWSDEQLTVEQLEHVVAVLHAKSDRDLARELNGRHLTQRLTAAGFERLNLELPGKETREALLAIADEAAFLDLPAADLLDLPAPGRAAQGRMVSRAAAFVATTVSRMPDFLATRTTTRFQDAYVMRSIEKHLIAVDGFRFIDRHEVTAVYRDGQEVDQGLTATKPEENINKKPGLHSWGEFGPLLGVVVADILKGKIGWSHWEQTGRWSCSRISIRGRGGQIELHRPLLLRFEGRQVQRVHVDSCLPRRDCVGAGHGRCIENRAEDGSLARCC